jgi:hypothetical protein
VSRRAQIGDRWELGLDFHLIGEKGSATLPWTAHPHSHWGSGPDALRALFKWESKQRGWRSLLMPTYFCQDVVASARRTAQVRVYPWAHCLVALSCRLDRATWFLSRPCSEPRPRCKWRDRR